MGGAVLMHPVPLLGDATWLGKCIQGSLFLHTGLHVTQISRLFECNALPLPPPKARGAQGVKEYCTVYVFSLGVCSHSWGMHFTEVVLFVWYMQKD